MLALTLPLSARLFVFGAQCLALLVADGGGGGLFVRSSGG